MGSITKINENIYRLVIPYKDIFTTVYTVRTDDGVLVFDSASFDEDTPEHIIPFFNEIGVDADSIKYVFISHNHGDHAGGLSNFMKHFPNVTIITRSPDLKEKFSGFSVLMPDDGDIVLGDLKVITIPGHTLDSSGIYDMRTKTLISGDSLQLWGIFGSGLWASNIRFPKEHFEAIEKLKKADIAHILTAHDYHPFGYSYVGKEIIEKALDACLEPLLEVKALILDNKDLNDEKIAKLFNNPERPTLGAHVVTAMRNMLK